MSDKNKKLIANLVPKPDDNRSVIQKLSELPEEERIRILDKIVEERYPEHGYEALKYDWSIWARPEQLPPQPYDAYRCWCILSGRGWGKLLPLSTEIPTIEGWKLMKNIKVGDKVFDEKGKPCNVTFVSEIEENPELYKITFSDNTIITACKDHQWTVWTQDLADAYKGITKRKGILEYLPNDWAKWEVNQINDKYLSLAEKNWIKELRTSGISIRETSRIVGRKRDTVKKYEKFIQEEIDVNTYTTLQLKTFIDKGKKILIPTTQPVEYEKQELPIEPWAFGYLLGDGNTLTGSYLACHPDDKYWLIDKYRERGFKVSEYPARNGHFAILENKRIWESLGLNLGKYIPDIYFKSSIEQRLELARGLFDSDGTVDKGGWYGFINTNPKLTYGLAEILSSLGLMPRVSEHEGKVDKRTGNKGKRQYLLYVKSDIPLASLPRKVGKAKHSRQLSQKTRYIKKIEKVNSEPGRCISVDSESSLYLATRAYIPTHNTRTGVEWIRWKVETGQAKRIAIIGQTSSSINGVILNGESGLLNIFPKWNRPHWSITNRTVTWPNGAVASMFSAEEPERLRGPQFDCGYVDELASFKYPEVMDMFLFGLRLGNNPQYVVTTTPKATKLLVDLIGNPTTYTTTGSTYDNKANLSSSFFTEVITKYEGTRLGRQELDAELLLESEGALWKQSTIDRNRIPLKDASNLPEFVYIVVAVDPATSTNKRSADTGIVVSAFGYDGNYYVLEAVSDKFSPIQWGHTVLELYDKWHADCVVVETNQGGDMVISNLQNIRPLVPVYSTHAQRGKTLRAEPIATLTERNKIKFVGNFQKLEDQLTNFDPQTVESNALKDLVDAFVYSLTYLTDKTGGSYTDYNPMVGGKRLKLINFKLR